MIVSSCESILTHPNYKRTVVSTNLVDSFQSHDDTKTISLEEFTSV
jgi:hypothetical protein